ncbi:lysophospholipase 1 [Diplocarpon rosae]|nr:lysophospholipase 1 [Diplocarpon rosae]
MNGAGFVAAADDRTANSTNTGQIGGLLQATTYLAGLSGGGWLVGSLYANNFSSVQTLRDGSQDSNVWRFDNSIFEGPDGDGIQLLSTADYFKTIVDEVQQKIDAGFNASVTDYWGRALSYQLINATNGGPSYTFSSIAQQAEFQSGSIPLPFLVADGRAPNTQIVSLNSTNFEFSPWELGSWDPSLYGFAPLEYTGSNFSAGAIAADGQCVRGLDQLGYVMGTSSTLFNQFLLQINSTAIPDFLRTIFTGLLTELGSDNDDIAHTDATIQNGTGFPSIPDPNTFVNLGLNNRPTFFGCNASNQTGAHPLLVYLPNAPFITYSNVSTFDPEYNTTQRNLIIRNGYEVATQGNGTADAQWPACLACAVLSRSWDRTATPVPAACTACFARYCWNGTTDSRPPGADYTPAFQGTEIHANVAVRSQGPREWGWASAAVAVAFHLFV